MTSEGIAHHGQATHVGGEIIGRKKGRESLEGREKNSRKLLPGFGGRGTGENPAGRQKGLKTLKNPDHPPAPFRAVQRGDSTPQIWRSSVATHWGEAGEGIMRQ